MITQEQSQSSNTYLFNIYFDSVWDQTQGFAHAWEALYH
jgi:hypothetical protein